MLPVLLDTTVIFAIMNRRDYNHERCIAALEQIRRPVVTCEAVICEAVYLCRHSAPAIQTILTNVANGNYQTPLRLSECALIVRDLMAKYADTPADFADACLIHLAELVDSGDILTLDSDFRHYRWRRNRRCNRREGQIARVYCCSRSRRG